MVTAIGKCLSVEQGEQIGRKNEWIYWSDENAVCLILYSCYIDVQDDQKSIKLNMISMHFTICKSHYNKTKRFYA